MGGIVDLLWEYINIVKTMESSPGLYTMDDIRAKSHGELASMLYPVFKDLPRDMVKNIIDEHLHNMDKYDYNAPKIIQSIKLTATSSTGDHR